MGVAQPSSTICNPAQTGRVAEACDMKAKVRLIKKEDRNPATPPVEAAVPDPKEWSIAVKSWVKESQDGRNEGAAEAFDNLFTDSTS